MKRVNIAVTGAAGQIGYALLFRIASGEMFGLDMEINLRLLELKTALPSLGGVLMELEDCAFPLLKSISISDDPKEAFKDIDWALLVGSVPRKAGMERSELLKINGSIFIEQGKALDEFAKPDCRVLVIGNPCNTNAFIAKSVTKRIPPENFFAMTMLDQKRATAQLAIKAKVDVASVKNMAIWGNHSSTQFPDFYHASLSGNPVLEVMRDEDWLKTAFIETVQNRGAFIIKARGLSSAASAAHSIIETVRALINPTPKGEFFSVAVSSDGSYGIDEGIMFSFPIRSDGKSWEIVQGISHNPFAQEKIEITRKELISEKEAVKDLTKSFFNS